MEIPLKGGCCLVPKTVAIIKKSKWHQMAKKQKNKISSNGINNNELDAHELLGELSESRKWEFPRPECQ